ncbi:hypothetical protein RCH23_003479, partial [Cryobacterium sp. CAN_C3]|nr:hypothetical protein [Cryobacterium sp. CAN_C3]
SGDRLDQQTHRQHRGQTSRLTPTGLIRLDKFRGANYSGNADYYTTSNASTCYGQTYTFASPSVVWNDQTSSFAGQGACQIRLYDDINYYGGFYGYFDCRSNLANVGYNDRASSVRFHLTNTYSCF